ncbi:MAG: ADP-ribosylglycohydrolase family protein [Spirochaetes bacterium]|nr:ADP-ribosylglycohydrolase family protein [Spirochaetota bacterium]
MNDKIKGALLGAVIGDALGTPFDGMSRGHISSSFKNISGYTDPSPALKGKMDRWRMPGLYSSISQIMILLSCYLADQKKFDEQLFVSLLKSIPGISENEYEIFRHPAASEKSFLNRINEETEDGNAAYYSFSCARPAVITIPAALIGRESDRSRNILSACKMFSGDYLSIAGAHVAAEIINSIVEQGNIPAGNLIIYSIEIIESLSAEIKTGGFKISDSIIDTDALANAIVGYKTVLSEIKNCADTGIAEKIICGHVNKKLKTPVTRATVNHPLAVIPFALHINANNPDESGSAILSAAREGGSSAVLCAVTGAVAGAVHGAESLTGELVDHLVNKKRIVALLDRLSDNKISQAEINDYIRSEVSLTRKETEELKARLRHQKIKPKKKKARKDKEQELTKHIVESWTKMDQARWRKKLGREKLPEG